MKKIVSMVLLVCMLLCCALPLSSCSKSPAAVVTAAMIRTGKLDSYEAFMIVDMTTFVLGVEVSIPMEIRIKAQDVHGKTPKMSADMSITYDGHTTTNVVYVEGDWLYTYRDHEGVKAKMEEDEAHDSDYLTSIKEMLQELPDSLFEDAELVENKNGSQTVKLELSDDELEDMFGNMLDSISDGAGADDVSTSDATVAITVKDRYIQSYRIAFDMYMDVEGYKTVTEVVVDLQFVNPGRDVEVEFPPDCEDFKPVKIWDID